MRRVAAVALAAGILLVAAGTSLPAGTTLRAGPYDRFACYPAQFSPFGAKKVALYDRLSQPFSAIVVMPETVCAPAGPGGVTAMTGYLTCYRVRSNAHPKPRSLKEPLRGTRMRPRRLQSLCVASVRMDTGTRDPASAALGPFTCYDASATAFDTEVTTTDAFGESGDSIHGPTRVCAPAATSGGLPLTTPYLACYDVVETATKGVTVVVRNSQFGTLKAALGPRGRLCVAFRG
jgi:hypothetical protein